LEGNAMNEWALLKDGHIVDVITTVATRSEVAKQYPGHQVADLHGLPPTVQKRYRYWDGRP
jgi:hypothetical protein